MSHKELEKLIGTALVSPSFREQLLNGSRRRLVQSFDLSMEEREAVLGAQADNLQELAGALLSWMDGRGAPEVDGFHRIGALS